MSRPLRSEIAASLSLDALRYSQVWEDADLLIQALDVRPSDRVLSICSAGCNALALLAAGAERVVALDMSPAQAALLDLKAAALRALDSQQIRQLLGLAPGPAGRHYTAVRHHLGERSRGFWDERPSLIEQGIANAGRLDAYFARFRDDYVRRCEVEEHLDALLKAPDLEAQRALLAEEGLGRAFDEAFRWYFGAANMAARGRDPAQFRYVDGGDVGLAFLTRLRDNLERHLLRTNPYTRFFLLGDYGDPPVGPPFLEEQRVERLRERLDGLHIVVDEVERHLSTQPPGTYTKANLSNIFEYMSEAATEEVMKLLARTLAPGGRIAYWNLLVPRNRPASLADRLGDDPAGNHRLHLQDRVFFYGAFRVHEVL